MIDEATRQLNNGDTVRTVAKNLHISNNQEAHSIAPSSTRIHQDDSKKDRSISDDCFKTEKITSFNPASPCTWMPFYD
ncbi:hypothetical protein BGX21_006823 [Mortierella sp. AD011]|nr:hypothetical protein BGX21_006823 [Mortierella sp. AD011]